MGFELGFLIIQGGTQLNDKGIKIHDGSQVFQ